ncbi:hypothetical protein ACJRO7_002819 [Eucalyptus globulus]|uniref:Uncharacterized protein n=1 Tax=Eucalyptus globulus TaxID=34317 RepID=A0ABD3LWP9_EUCGL
MYSYLPIFQLINPQAKDLSHDHERHLRFQISDCPSRPDAPQAGCLALSVAPQLVRFAFAKLFAGFSAITACSDGLPLGSYLKRRFQQTPELQVVRCCSCRSTPVKFRANPTHSMLHMFTSSITHEESSGRGQRVRGRPLKGPSF